MNLPTSRRESVSFLFFPLSLHFKEAVSDAYEHLRENSRIALSMQQYGQHTGHPSNVSVIGSPIFEIDTSAPAGSEYDDDDDYIEGDYGAYK